MHLCVTDHEFRCTTLKGIAFAGAGFEDADDLTASPPDEATLAAILHAAGAGKPQKDRIATALYVAPLTPPPHPPPHP
jgi:hypothetical protein